MTPEPMTPTPDILLPPARTRDVALEAAPVRGLGLLAPALSGLFGRAPRAAPASLESPAAALEQTDSYSPPPSPLDAEEEPAGDTLIFTEIEQGTVYVDDHGDVEIVAEEVTIELEGFTDLEADDVEEEGALAEPAVQWFGDDTSAPWEEAEAIDGIEAQAAGEPDLYLAEDEAAGDIVLDTADEAVEEDAEGAEPDIRQAPPPLSPWDLGAASTSGEAGERAARARAEWESLGQALSESLIAAGPPPEEPGPHGYELTDEKAAELDAEDESPFGGPVIAVGSTGTTESPVSELVRRLETFAASLRDEGPSALSRAQTGDDRFDALLASIAAGFLAGRGE